MPLFDSLQQVSNDFTQVAGNVPIVGGLVNGISNSFTGQRPPILQDNDHAAKRFGLDGTTLSEIPRPKFLFWVQFFGNGINGLAANSVSNTDTGQKSTDGLSFLVKSVEKPKVTPVVEEIHQYNKKRLIHTGINYEPITIKFHDSVGDGIINFWRDYYYWYFGDGRSKTVSSWEYDATSANLNGLNQYGSYEFGFSPDPTNTIPGSTGLYPGATNFFLQEIRIWQFWGGYFTSMSLVNPKITSFDNDEYDYAESTTSQVTMQIKYESVIYHAQKQSLKIAAAQGGISQQQIHDFLLDLGNYYNFPYQQSADNGNLLSRLGVQSLEAVLQNVINGKPANYGNVLQGVVSNALPFGLGSGVKAAIQNVENQFVPNAIQNVGSSALSLLGGFTSGLAQSVFGSSSTGAANTVSDPRITSFQAPSYVGAGGTASLVQTRGAAPNVNSGATGPSGITTGANGAVIDASLGTINTSNPLAASAFGDALGNGSTNGFGSPTSLALNDSSGSTLSVAGQASLNAASGSGTQFGSTAGPLSIVSVSDAGTTTQVFSKQSALFNGSQGPISLVQSNPLLA